MKLHRAELLKTAFLMIACSISSCCWAQGKGMVSFESSYSVAETEQRLIQILKSKDFKIFTRINHSDGAKAVNIKLPETRVVIFGKPQIGSKLMLCSPSVAIDLPQKMLIWKDGHQVKLAFNSPKFLQKRHQMNGCETLLKKINGALNKIAEKVTS
ncbi:MAG: hypothetical protein COB38_10320 [Gammaproteobacteria bacterium]|nr:MAG: hypothetical protein COB38_10320 [Gammaproteobacteria bacterium]